MFRLDSILWMMGMWVWFLVVCCWNCLSVIKMIFFLGNGGGGMDDGNRLLLLLVVSGRKGMWGC